MASGGGLPGVSGMPGKNQWQTRQGEIYFQICAGI